MRNLLFVLVVLVFPFYVQAEHHENGKSPSEVVSKAYETFSSGNMEGWKALHSDDLEFRILGDLPQSGTHVGAQETIENVFSVLPVHWPGFLLEEINRYSVGNTVIVHLRMTAEGLETESLHKFEVVDGKIKSFIAFDDTQSMFSSMQ